MKTVMWVMRDIFRCAPVSAFVVVLNYVFVAAVPAVIMVVSVGMFDAAATVVSGGTARDSLFFYAAVYLAVYLLNDIIFVFYGVAINAGVYETCMARFRIDLYEKLSKLPLIAFEDAGNLDKLKRSEEALEGEYMSSLFTRVMIMLGAAGSTVSVGVVLTRYSIWLLPLSLLSVFPYLLARLIRGKEFFRVKQAQAKKTRLLSYLWKLFSTRQPAKEMRVMGFEDYITDKWRGVRDEVKEELWEISAKDAKSLLICDAIRIIGYGISVAVVLYLVIKGQISIGVLGASLTSFLSLQDSMKDFLFSLGKISEFTSFANDYYSFFDLENEREGTENFDGLKEKISLDAVSFRYPNSQTYAVKDVSLEIRKGEKIVVLGENGSGKTTLAKIILGLYAPGCGTVSFDGADIRDFTKFSFFKKISAVAQDFTSYKLTIAENVGISDIERLTDKAGIQEALDGSGLNQVGSQDTMLGREFGGIELSGGQWQRLAIARGLFKESELIILDEPTAALDPLVETDILKKFIEASKDRTSIIISHRVGLCRMVDRIIVMKDGAIAEIGSHSELMERGGEYYQLYTSQEQWY